MIKNFYIVGAGGYGQQLQIFLKKNKFVNSVKFIDDKLTLNIDKFAKIKIKKKIHYNIAISNPSIRENIYQAYAKKNFIYKTFIFPNKNIYSNKIGDGCIVEPNTLIANNVIIGVGNYIFFGTSIAHNVKIGNFCNFGCYVVISGNAKIGNKVIIGAHTFISNNVSICDNVTITPGSIIMKSIKKPGIYHNNLVIKSI